ncbi:MAG: DUF1501 domain-containing protein [Pseudomonadota bacterium]
MKLDQQRRSFLQKLLIASGVATLPVLPSVLFAQTPNTYQGKLLVTLQLDGGVDVTSFCDPKSNVPGEREINRWARTQEIRTAGNLQYAPYGDNTRFFDKYYRHMLVINGVDTQTNAHSVGVVNNWSGRSSEGLPTLTALFSAVKAPQLPMTYLNFGGYGATEGVTTLTKANNIRTLQNAILPNAVASNAAVQYVQESDLDRVMALHKSTLSKQVGVSGVIGGNQINRQSYLDALEKTDAIAEFASYIPSAENLKEPRQIVPGRTSNLHQQVQLALLAFKSGVSVAADLFESGFDTHDNHDSNHPKLLANVTDALDYFWTLAVELGLADRIVLVIGSDFGRTPYFNISQGKDHWPIGSTIVMEKNAAYGNRMLGKTDEGHNALKIDPSTLQQSNARGVMIKPAHVHKALRRYLGLEASAITQRFTLSNTEDFRFFG